MVSLNCYAILGIYCEYGTYLLDSVVGGRGSEHAVEKKPVTAKSTVVWFDGCDIISSITEHYTSHYEHVYLRIHGTYKCLGHLQTLQAELLLKSMLLICTTVNNEWRILTSYYSYL